MRITVKVRDQSAASRGDSTTAHTESLGKALRESGVTLEPMHPGSEDPALASWFTAEVEDDRVDDVLRALRSSAAIEAAYVKPAEEPP
jgi:hypothetical protein